MSLQAKGMGGRSSRSSSSSRWMTTHGSDSRPLVWAHANIDALLPYGLLSLVSLPCRRLISGHWFITAGLTVSYEGKEAQKGDNQTIWQQQSPEWTKMISPCSLNSIWLTNHTAGDKMFLTVACYKHKRCVTMERTFTHHLCSHHQLVNLSWIKRREGQSWQYWRCCPLLYLQQDHRWE